MLLNLLRRIDDRSFRQQAEFLNVPVSQNVNGIMDNSIKALLISVLIAWAEYGRAQPHTDGKLNRLAVIGSGMGGATAAWLIHNTTGCKVDVFEASDIVGGRLKETTIDGRVVELGGSIGIEANQYFVETTELLGLKRREQPSSSAGIWDGDEFVFKSSDSMLAKFLRCALSHFRAIPRCQQILLPRRPIAEV